MLATRTRSQVLLVATLALHGECWKSPDQRYLDKAQRADDLERSRKPVVALHTSVPHRPWDKTIEDNSTAFLYNHSRQFKYADGMLPGDAWFAKLRQMVHEDMRLETIQDSDDNLKSLSARAGVSEELIRMANPGHRPSIMVPGDVYQIPTHEEVFEDLQHYMHLKSVPACGNATEFAICVLSGRNCSREIHCDEEHDQTASFLQSTERMMKPGKRHRSGGKNDPSLVEAKEAEAAAIEATLTDISNDQEAGSGSGSSSSGEQLQNRAMNVYGPSGPHDFSESNPAEAMNGKEADIRDEWREAGHFEMSAPVPQPAPPQPQMDYTASNASDPESDNPETLPAEEIDAIQQMVSKHDDLNPNSLSDDDENSVSNGARVINWAQPNVSSDDDAGFVNVTDHDFDYDKMEIVETKVVLAGRAAVVNHWFGVIMADRAECALLRKFDHWDLPQFMAKLGHHDEAALILSPVIEGEDGFEQGKTKIYMKGVGSHTWLTDNGDGTVSWFSGSPGLEQQFEAIKATEGEHFLKGKSGKFLGGRDSGTYHGCADGVKNNIFMDNCGSEGCTWQQWTLAIESFPETYMPPSLKEGQLLTTDLEKERGYTFLFNGCPRGGPAQRWANKGRYQLAQCQSLCDADPACNAIEVNGCNSNANCGGACYHFYGSGSGPITNGNCVTNGDQKCYGKGYGKFGGTESRSGDGQYWHWTSNSQVQDANPYVARCTSGNWCEGKIKLPGTSGADTLSSVRLDKTISFKKHGGGVCYWWIYAGSTMIYSIHTSSGSTMTRTAQLDWSGSANVDGAMKLRIKSIPWGSQACDVMISGGTQLSASSKSTFIECPGGGNCNGNGICQKETGQCVCAANYYYPEWGCSTYCPHECGKVEGYGNCVQNSGCQCAESRIGADCSERQREDRMFAVASGADWRGNLIWFRFYDVWGTRHYPSSVGLRNFKNMERKYNDRISSVRVAQGGCMCLYQNDGCKDKKSAKKLYKGNHDDIGSMKDKTSSMRVWWNCPSNWHHDGHCSAKDGCGSSWDNLGEHGQAKCDSWVWHNFYVECLSCHENGNSCSVKKSAFGSVGRAFENIGKAIGNAFASAWEGTARAVNKGIKVVGDFVESVVDAVVAFGEMIYAFLTGAWWPTPSDFYKIYKCSKGSNPVAQAASQYSIFKTGISILGNIVSMVGKAGVHNAVPITTSQCMSIWHEMEKINPMLSDECLGDVVDTFESILRYIGMHRVTIAFAIGVGISAGSYTAEVEMGLGINANYRSCFVGYCTGRTTSVDITTPGPEMGTSFFKSIDSIPGWAHSYGFEFSIFGQTIGGEMVVADGVSGIDALIGGASSVELGGFSPTPIAASLEVKKCYDWGSNTIHSWTGAGPCDSNC